MGKGAQSMSKKMMNDIYDDVINKCRTTVKRNTPENIKRQIGVSMPQRSIDYIDDLSEHPDGTYWQRSRSKIVAMIIEKHAITAGKKEKGG
jgi:hypothetical protein